MVTTHIRMLKNVISLIMFIYEEITQCILLKQLYFGFRFGIPMRPSLLYNVKHIVRGDNKPIPYCSEVTLEHPSVTRVLAVWRCNNQKVAQQSVEQMFMQTYWSHHTMFQIAAKNVSMCRPISYLTNHMMIYQIR